MSASRSCSLSMMISCAANQNSHCIRSNAQANEHSSCQLRQIKFIPYKTVVAGAQTLSRNCEQLESSVKNFSLTIRGFTTGKYSIDAFTNKGVNKILAFECSLLYLKIFFGDFISNLRRFNKQIAELKPLLVLTSLVNRFRLEIVWWIKNYFTIFIKFYPS